jgi:predicted methyltransferase
MSNVLGSPAGPVKAAWLASLLSLSLACGGAKPDGVPPAEPNPLVHRFEHAAEWTKELDGPERDAWQKPADVIAAMQLRAGMRVADIGAGTGYFEPWLSRAVGPTGTVLALDIEPDMVRHLGERAAHEQLANVKPALVTMGDPGLPQGQIDRVLIVDTWHHIPDREAYSTKLHDALAPGGAVVVVDFTMEATHGPPRPHRIPPDQVLHELGAADLAAEVLPVKLPEQYVVVGRRP